jgi:hypothetical protein
LLISIICAHLWLNDWLPFAVLNLL